MTTEKFCLKWNDFTTNVLNSVSRLRNETKMFDVTLMGNDQKPVSAHKLVLSACSEYFKDIFKHNIKPNAHTLLCLNGVSSDDLRNIMDYIYNGEVQIFQENLDNFLNIAQRLKLEGLIGNNVEDSQEVNDDDKNIAKDENPMEEAHYEKPINRTPQPKPRQLEKVDYKSIVSLSLEDVSEVDNAVNENMEKIASGMWKCKLCEKTATRTYILKNHIETHLEGLSFPCQLCGKTFRSRPSYKNHKCFHNRKNYNNI